MDKLKKQLDNRKKQLDELFSENTSHHMVGTARVGAGGVAHIQFLARSGAHTFLRASSLLAAFLLTAAPGAAGEARILVHSFFLLDAGRKGQCPGSPCAVCPEHANHKPRHGSADFGLHTYARTLCTLAAGIRCYTNNNNDMRMLPNSASVAIDCPSTHQVQFCSAARVCKTAQDAPVRPCSAEGGGGRYYSSGH
jgi:hypothetical protein